jgi:hypothetical protein
MKNFSRLGLLLTGISLLIGCSTSRTASTTGRVMVKTVSTVGTVAGKTAVATASTAGKAAVKATKTAVPVTKNAVGAVVALAKGNVVTFFDKTTGIVKQVPWSDGLQLYAASESAKVDLSLKAIRIVRGSQVIQSSWDKLKSGAASVTLQPGDMVELTRLATK